MVITEDYCSNEIFKLLRKKGFEGEFHTIYNNEGYTQPSATIQMAMKWLREVHKLHCDIGYDDLDWFWNVISVSEDVPTRDRPKLIMNGYACNKTYEQACEAAIRYCLEKLI